MDAPALQAVAEELTMTMKDIQASRYLSAAGYFVMIYDHTITFSEEVQLIWRGPLSLVSALFLINRYAVPGIIAVDLYEKGGFARNLSHCHDWIAVESNLQILSFTIAHALVAMRVSVLWNTHPWVKTMLISLGGSYLVATLLLTNFVNKALLPTLGWQPVLNLCFGQLPRWTAWIFVPSLLFECLLFGLTVTRAIQHRRRDISVTEGVIGVLYRDGMLYFIVITGCSLFNIIVWGALRPSLVVLAKFFTFSFVNVMASRIVLNLRAQRFSNQATQFTSASSSSNSSSFPGFTFAGRLKAARQSAATRNARTERPDIWMSGERIALRGLNLGNMPLSNGRGVSESSRRHLGDCLENPHQNSEGKVDGDLESRGGTPSVWMDMDVMTDTDAEADHGME